MTREAIAIGTWNLEWAPPASRRGKCIAEVLTCVDADLLCLTEAFEGSAPQAGEALSCQSGNDYADRIDGKKVLLWSRHGWLARIEPPDDALFASRFVGGVVRSPIRDIQVIGVCIPYAGSRHSTASSQWHDHLSYLTRLRDVLSALPVLPTVVVGDFNQRVPRGRQPNPVFEALMQTFSGRFAITTAGLADADGDETIDHVAITRELDFQLRSLLPKVSENGQRLSDHFGLAGTLALASG